MKACAGAAASSASRASACTPDRIPPDFFLESQCFISTTAEKSKSSFSKDLTQFGGKYICFLSLLRQ
jgi:hypothetical protein